MANQVPAVFITLFKRLFLSPGFTNSSNNQCKIYNADRVRKDGYVYIKFRRGGKVKCASVQRVCVMLCCGTFDLGKLDVSHLCHNKLCIQPNHLSLENRATNCRRKRCVSAGVCRRHPKGDGTFYPDCILGLQIQTEHCWSTGITGQCIKSQSNQQQHWWLLPLPWPGHASSNRASRARGWTTLRKPTVILILSWR